jgi:hypothetical protein
MVRNDEVTKAWIATSGTPRNDADHQSSLRAQRGNPSFVPGFVAWREGMKGMDYHREVLRNDATATLNRNENTFGSWNFA